MSRVGSLRGQGQDARMCWTAQAVDTGCHQGKWLGLPVTWWWGDTCPWATPVLAAAPGRVWVRPVRPQQGPQARPKGRWPLRGAGLCRLLHPTCCARLALPSSADPLTAGLLPAFPAGPAQPVRPGVATCACVLGVGTEQPARGVWGDRAADPRGETSPSQQPGTDDTTREAWALQHLSRSGWSKRPPRRARPTLPLLTHQLHSGARPRRPEPRVETGGSRKPRPARASGL